jgi:hypothetical protein
MASRKPPRASPATRGRSRAFLGMPGCVGLQAPAPIFPFLALRLPVEVRLSRPRSARSSEASALLLSFAAFAQRPKSSRRPESRLIAQHHSFNNEGSKLRLLGLVTIDTCTTDYGPATPRTPARYSLWQEQSVCQCLFPVGHSWQPGAIQPEAPSSICRDRVVGGIRNRGVKLGSTRLYSVV